MRSNRFVRTLPWVLALAASLAGAGAQAQRGDRRPARAEAAPPAAPPSRGRGQDPYSVRSGFLGTITANTPNEYGNLGGPGTGGGGGGR
jgi:hypothetical protein